LLYSPYSDYKMSEKGNENSFLSSFITKESLLSGGAVAVAITGTYINASQISSLKEIVEGNEKMLITTIQNVDQLVGSAPDPEKINEIKKSINLNSQLLAELKASVEKLNQISQQQERRLRSLEQNAGEWLGYHTPQEFERNHQRAPNQGGAYPPNQGGAYPPNQGGAYQNQGSVYPPNQGGAYPPNQGGAYPPNQGGAYQNQGSLYPPNQGGPYSNQGAAYNEPRSQQSTNQNFESRSRSLESLL